MTSHHITNIFGTLPDTNVILNLGVHLNRITPKTKRVMTLHTGQTGLFRFKTSCKQEFTSVTLKPNMTGYLDRNVRMRVFVSVCERMNEYE